MDMAKDIYNQPTYLGKRVRRTQGRPADVGRTGVVTRVLGSMSGDTRIEVTEDDGTVFACYTRQVKPAQDSEG